LRVQPEVAVEPSLPLTTVLIRCLVTAALPAEAGTVETTVGRVLSATPVESPPKGTPRMGSGLPPQPAYDQAHRQDRRYPSGAGREALGQQVHAGSVAWQQQVSRSLSTATRRWCIA